MSNDIPHQVRAAVLMGVLTASPVPTENPDHYRGHCLEGVKNLCPVNTMMERLFRTDPIAPLLIKNIVQSNHSAAVTVYQPMNDEGKQDFVSLLSLCLVRSSSCNKLLFTQDSNLLVLVIPYKLLTEIDVFVWDLDLCPSAPRFPHDDYNKSLHHLFASSISYDDCQFQKEELEKSIFLGGDPIAPMLNDYVLLFRSLPDTPIDVHLHILDDGKQDLSELLGIINSLDRKFFFTTKDSSYIVYMTSYLNKIHLYIWGKSLL